MQASPMARIFNIQKYSIYDGPGIRTLVFFQGCPLQCLWCSNPEGQMSEPKILFNSNLCTNCGSCVPVCPEHLHIYSGTPPLHIVNHDGCTGCGACAHVCPQRALALSGKAMSVDEILAVVLEDREFYETSGGGVTVGGGEPLMQWQAVGTLLDACHREGISTAMETSGHAGAEVIRHIAPRVDLFLYDIKQMDSQRHRDLTGVGNERVLENLNWLLDNGYNVRVRMPLVNGCNADENEIRARAAFLAPWKDSSHFKGVDLLPYHKIGIQKYAHLGRGYALDACAPINDECLSRSKAIFEEAGITVSVIRH